MMERTKRITGVGLLLAVMIVFQSLRIFIPMPPWINTFIIGSLVNASLVVALKQYGLSSSLLLGVIAPVVAALQGHLVHPLLIVPVGVANIIYITLVKGTIERTHWIIAALISGVGKMIVLFFSFHYLLPLLAIPEPIATMLKFVMSWPQFITGFFGVVLSTLIIKKLEKSN